MTATLSEQNLNAALDTMFKWYECLISAVTDVEADLAVQKLFVTSDKPQEELLATLQKTGKKVEYVGQCSWRYVTRQLFDRTVTDEY